MIPSRTTICLVGIALVAVSALMSIFALSANYRERSRLTRYLGESVLQERLGGVLATINDFPGSAGKDLLFLRTLSSLATFFESDLVSWRNVSEDLHQFLERNSAYDAFYVYDDTHGCVLAAGRPGGNEECSCAAADGSISEAASAARQLPFGGVHISRLVKLSCAGEEPIAAMLYATRISAPVRGGGVLVAVVNADYFLEEIRRLSRRGEPVYLLRSDGAYLAHPDRSEEWIAGGSGNLYADYPHVAAGALQDLAMRHAEADGQTFTFMRITPTTANFVPYDSKGGTGEYWVLAAVSEKGGGSVWWFSTSYLIAVTLILIVHTLVAAVLALILLPHMQHKP